MSADDERDEMDDFILHIHRQLAKMDDKLDELKAQTRPKPPRPTILKLDKKTQTEKWEIGCRWQERAPMPPKGSRSSAKAKAKPPRR